MGEFGNRPLNGEEMRWGLEHLKIDNAELEKLGMIGLLQPLDVSPTDHEGGGAARIQCWDGQSFELVTDWIQGEVDVVQELAQEVSAKYAEDHGIALRNPDGTN